MKATAVPGRMSGVVIKQTRGERVFDFFNVIFMVLVCALFIYPLLYVLSRSVMSDAERVARPLALIPHAFDWAGYKMVLSSNSNLLNSYWVTIRRTVIGTLVNLLLTSMLAYVISRKRYSLRTPLTFMLAFTMWFDGGLIPTYLLNQSLGMVNNFWVYILPAAISPWNCFILRNFFASLPDSLEESAHIDGASESVILFRIVLPLSKAALATVGLFYAVWHWNSWFDSMLYMTNNKLWSLQYILRQIIASANTSDLVAATTDASINPPTEMVRMACTVVATVPILCVYPFLQKYFVKGMLVGSVKG
ncbi:carbohydrate ABC transporter permease [Eubacteriales bacterium OttesenSCG-928-A19]|nr:carbohydrate ABC transporter permease [Eubacteriales bacterium OttesenSCG-928-A19]